MAVPTRLTRVHRAAAPEQGPIRVALLSSKVLAVRTRPTRAVLATPPTWAGLAVQGEGRVPAGPLNNSKGLEVVRTPPTLAAQATRPTRVPALAVRVAAVPGVPRARRLASRRDKTEDPPPLPRGRTGSLVAGLVQEASHSNSLPLVRGLALDLDLDLAVLELNLSNNLRLGQALVAALDLDLDLALDLVAPETNHSNSLPLDQTPVVARVVVVGLFLPPTPTDRQGPAGAE